MTVSFEDGMKLTGSKNMLNDVALAFAVARTKSDEVGLEALRDQYADRYETIYNALDTVGYYK